MVRKERRREVPNPMIQKVRGVGGHGGRTWGSPGVPWGPPPSPHCLLAPQTRRCAKERPAYAVSSSEDEDPSKEIGVTYKSTRSAVRTERGGGPRVRGQLWLAREAPRMWDQLLISYSCFLAIDALLCPFALHTPRARFILSLPPALLAGHRRLVVFSQRWELNLPHVTQSFQVLSLIQVYLIVRFMFTALEQLPRQGIHII